MKIKNTRGFGKVTDPRTGDEIDVEEPFETDRDTFEALDARYPGFEVVSEGDDLKGKTEESGGEAPDLEELADEHWRTVVSAIEDGDLDGQLDELAEVDDRQSVQNAIAERR